MAALSEASSAFHRPKPWSLLTADKDATRIKKTARALLRAAFISGCRLRFHRYTPMDEQRKGFVVGLRKALGDAFAIAAVVDTSATSPIVGQKSRNPQLRQWHTKHLGRLPGLKFMRTLWVFNVSGRPPSSSQPPGLARRRSALGRRSATSGSPGRIL
jgi:hypothetical protein